MYTYPGNIHIHSRHSDGTGDFQQIAAAAARAGLRYLIITDHETLAGKAEEGFLHGVAILVGVEINRQHSHYLALDLDTPVAPNSDHPQLVIDQVHCAGGFGIIAHPFEKGSPFIENGKAYPWKVWPVFDFDGLEIWNYTSHWRGRHPSKLKTIYWYLFNRNGAMDGPPRGLTKLWDCYNLNGHRVVGIGGSDAHAFLYRLGPFTFRVFDYRFLFGTINTYLVLHEELGSDFEKAREQIYQALRAGCCYLSYDSLNPGHGFVFEARNNGYRALMGSDLPFNAEVVFQIKSPRGRPLIRLLRNGVVLVAEKAASLSYRAVEPGLYRVEVYHCPLIGRPRPWIYSNPIWLTAVQADD